MTTAQCAHHWIIETPNGPISKGKCQLCGEEREFNNSIDFQGAAWTSQPRRYPVAPQPEGDDGE